MEYLELIENLKKVKCDELRSHEAEFFEIVIRKETLNQLAGVLEGFFGKPLKPADQEPTSEARKIAEPYGGVWKNQTFYFADRETHNYSAMLWPWSNGTQITLKVIQRRKY